MPAARARARARRRGDRPRSPTPISDSDLDDLDFYDDAMELLDVDMVDRGYMFDQLLDGWENQAFAPEANGAADKGARSESDDSDIQVLEEAPEHLRPAIPSSPIVVSSDDEDDDDELLLQRPSKRSASNSFELLDSPPKSKQRVHERDDQPVAGPSNASDTIVTDVEYLVPVVLEVIPDACPIWVRDNLKRIVETLKNRMVTPGQAAVDHVINAALEMEQYPRVGDADKAVVKEKEKGDFKDPKYRAHAREGLHIRYAWSSHGNFQLVTTYLYLHGLSTVADKPYHELKRRRGVKGKSRAEMPEESSSSSFSQDNEGGLAEFYLEYAFLKKLMANAAEKEQKEAAAAAAKEKQETDHVERRKQAVAEGRSRECGCCFDEEALEDLVACPEGHMFCRQCVTSLAENKLGEQLTNITCMDISQCDAAFTDAVLADVCGEKTMSLYHRLRQIKDLEMAAIDGLESCPSCPFAMVIENPDEKLFRCFNPDCNKVTCRKCKRPDHIPKRCEEVEENFKLDKRHAIEEAMSAALMRRCPKCDKPYLKESGCNKITCQNCRTVSCYICQKAIPEDYAHFDQMPGRVGKKPNKCQLWDTGNENQAEADRILNARDEALKAAREAAVDSGLDLNDADLHVDAPAAAPQAPGPLGAGRFAYLPGMGGLDAPADAQHIINCARVLGNARRRLQELQPPEHRDHPQDIIGLGRMLANHENALNAHQAAVVAHGDHLMHRIARLAPPMAFEGLPPGLPQPVLPPPLEPLPPWPPGLPQPVLPPPLEPVPPWPPGVDFGGVGYRVDQRALAAQIAAMPPPRPAPPAPPAPLAAWPAALPFPPHFDAGEAHRLRARRVAVEVRDAQVRALLAMQRARDAQQRDAQLRALLAMQRARLVDDQNGDIAGLARLPPLAPAGGGAAAVQPPYQVREQVCQEAERRALFLPDSDDDEPLAPINERVLRRQPEQAPHADVAQAHVARADELIALFNRRRDRANRPGNAGRPDHD
ncbi:hypothetical protein CcaverHIS641_0302110 [Cutaneotrichosporon cavernicola]|nr:hypothetical protein CcaverHIS641_0302110 [Cutaneotrichosporon cavernicola]